MLININNIKILLGIDINDNTYDDLLNILYNNALSYVENYIGYKLQLETIEEIYDGNGERILQLNNSNIVGIISIEYKNSEDWSNNDYVLLDKSEYTFKKVGEVYFNSNIYRGYNKYKINYTYGFDENTIDYGLKGVIQDLIVSYFNQNTINNNNIKSESIDGVSVTYNNNSNILDNTFSRVNTILDKYVIYDI